MVFQIHTVGSHIMAEAPIRNFVFIQSNVIIRFNQFVNLQGTLVLGYQAIAVDVKVKGSTQTWPFTPVAVTTCSEETVMYHEGHAMYHVLASGDQRPRAVGRDCHLHPEPHVECMVCSS